MYDELIGGLGQAVELVGAGITVLVHGADDAVLEVDRDLVGFSLKFYPSICPDQGSSKLHKVKQGLAEGSSIGFSHTA